MDSEPFVTALKAAIHRLRQLASEDAQLRTQLRRMAEAIFEITDIPDQPAVAVQEPVAQEPPVGQVAAEVISPVETQEPAPAPAPAVVPEAHLSAPPPIVLPEQNLGQAEPAVEPARITHPTRWRKTTNCAFSLIEARCRLKAEGARWAVTRRRLVAEGANFRTEIEPKEQDIISRAGSLEDCLLWMCQLSGTSPNRYEDVARCFDAVADILSVVKQARDEPEFERRWTCWLRPNPFFGSLSPLSMVPPIRIKCWCPTGWKRPQSIGKCSCNATSESMIQQTEVNRPIWHLGLKHSIPKLGQCGGERERRKSLATA